MSTLFLLFLLLLSFPATAAFDKAEAWRLCADLSTKGQTWTPTVNPSLFAYSEEFLRNTNARATHILICASDEPSADLAWSVLVGKGFEHIFVLGMSRDALTSLGSHLRAVVAHEVGHLVVNHTGGACDNFTRQKRNDDYVLCEHDADWVAMNWIGKPAMLTLLRTLLHHRERNFAPREHLENLAKRISLLERAP